MATRGGVRRGGAKWRDHRLPWCLYTIDGVAFLSDESQQHAIDR